MQTCTSNITEHDKRATRPVCVGLPLRVSSIRVDDIRGIDMRQSQPEL